MRACAVYSTYVVAGNDGALRESGIDKLKQLFAEMSFRITALTLT